MIMDLACFTIEPPPSKQQQNIDIQNCKAYLEMFDLDALVAGVLVRQMVQLLLEWRRVKGQVDNGVNAVGHTDAVSREFRRFQVVGADAGKGGLGVRGFLKKSGWNKGRECIQNKAML